MSHSLPVTPQFLVTAFQPCPYLDGRVERKMFMLLNNDDFADAINDRMTAQGFRRSQNVIYRPACAKCAACMAARIRVEDFQPTRSQRRTLARNVDIERRPAQSRATEEQYDLFSRYLASRHHSGGMTEMGISEFAAMINETQVQSRVIEYHLSTADGGRRLVGACLTDVLEDGLSMIYSFFDPSEQRRSLGIHIILDHIEIARRAGLSHVYLGYWVPGSPKMEYKARFNALEVYHRDEWIQLHDPVRDPPDTNPPENNNILDQMARIHIPDSPMRRR